MTEWLNMGEMLRVNGKLYASKPCLMDAHRSYTFLETHRRTNKLANSLLDLGIGREEKIACLLENSVEICELYFAVAKMGAVIVPINFRLVANEVAYILENSDATAVVFHEEFLPVIEEIRERNTNIKNYICVGDNPGWALGYEDFLNQGDDGYPALKIDPESPWILLYTSGTTGRPKGVIRSHASHVAFYLINGIDFGFNNEGINLTVMPLCHVNTTFFSFNFTYLGATIFIHPARSFKGEEILSIIDKYKITFISLVPTHYNILLNVPPEIANKYDRGSVKKLLCSSAPVRAEQLKQILEFFPGVELFEAYGSTEAGIVTVLKPLEQESHLGSIGRESCGTDLIKILDADGNQVKRGEIGELYSRGPMLFTEYYKMREVTETSFRNGWFSAGDMGYEDEDGYYYLMDRKHNMIITGGENVYPSEVEDVLSSHHKIYDLAVFGIPHDKWGEQVTAAVVLKEGETATEEEIINFCKDKIAGYKRPKQIIFIRDDEMPRTYSGKNLHSELRKRYQNHVSDK